MVVWVNNLGDFMAINKNKRRLRRKRRVRKGIVSKSDRPRITVFKSGKHIYAQIIDDVKGVTLVSASTVGKSAASVDKKKKYDASIKVGSTLATKAIEKGIKNVVFDRNGYPFHGRIKALADAAREKGLVF